jgi:carbamoylphosphate synthase large subunit
MQNKQLILLASAFTYRVNAFEQAAQRLGIPVIRGEDVPPPMVSKVKLPLAIDYRDVPRSARLIEKYARKHPVGAIIGLDDSGTLIAAAASERIGLPYNAPEAALAARDKYLMRQKFAQAGVPSPEFHHYHLNDDLPVIAARTRYPCVVKPTILAGSRGVMRADDPAEFIQRVERLRDILATEPCDEFLVEDFIPGVEVALEGLMDSGKLHVLALFDKPDPLDGPFFEETLYVTPSRMPVEIQTAIALVAQQAAAALGLVTGPVHAELRINQAESALNGAESTIGEPVMVEIAARSIGGSCSKTLRFDLNTSLEELIIRQSFQLPITPETAKRGTGSDNFASFPHYQLLDVASGVMMIPIAYSGLLTRIDGIESATRVPLITEIEITAPLNQRIKGLPEGDSYLGFIFARGETPAAVEAALREAYSLLDIEIVEEIELKIS